MKVLNDFNCNRCGILYVDRFLENDITTFDCQSCGGVAEKVRPIPRFQLPGNDKAGFPTSYDKWERDRKQKMAQEQKQNPQS
jgi:hypothetical protein